MNIVEIAKNYATGAITEEEASEKMGNLNYPVYNTTWDGKYLVSGDPKNSIEELNELRYDNVISTKQYYALINMIPETDSSSSDYSQDWKSE